MWGRIWQLRGLLVSEDYIIFCRVVGMTEKVILQLESQSVFVQCLGYWILLAKGLLVLSKCRFEVINLQEPHRSNSLRAPCTRALYKQSMTPKAMGLRVNLYQWELSLVVPLFVGSPKANPKISAWFHLLGEAWNERVISREGKGLADVNWNKSIGLNRTSPICTSRPIFSLSHPI